MALVPTTAPGRGTVSEFLKLVAEAGGTAHLATFARLGVVNTPAVRESFPVLLDHSVPEAVLVAILAPVPPAAPTTLVSQTPRAPVVSSSGIHDGGTRGHGARSPSRHLGGDRLQLAGAIHSPGHGIPREDADGARRPGQLPALPPPERLQAMACTPTVPTWKGVGFSMYILYILFTWFKCHT